jgi:hypothetical protein
VGKVLQCLLLILKQPRARFTAQGDDSEQRKSCAMVSTT